MDKNIRLAAAGWLTDAKLQAELIWNEHVAYDVHVAAAKNVTDKALLIRIAEEKVDDVYEAAVARLDDTQVLLVLAKGKDVLSPRSTWEGKAMERLNQLAPELVACLVPERDGKEAANNPNPEELWDRYYTVALERRRRCVGRSSIVKRA